MTRASPQYRKIRAMSDPVEEVLAQHPRQQAALLPILHDLQERVGHIPSEAVKPIAEALNLSRAEVHGVISFYHFFRTAPGAKRTLYLCRAEACQSMGGRALQQHLESAHGLTLHGQSSDGRFNLEPVYCLGNCACAPAIMVDRELIGRVDTATLDRLLAADIT